MAGLLLLTCIVAYATFNYYYSPKFTVPNAAIRIVGSSSSSQHEVLFHDAQVSHVIYSYEEQREFLQKYSSRCHSKNMLQRYDELPLRYQQHLFQYCILYMGHGNIWLNDGVLLADVSELINIKGSIGVLQDRGMLHSSFLKVHARKASILREMMQLLMDTSNEILERYDVLIEKTMFARVQNVADQWTLWKLSCVDLVKNPQLDVMMNTAPQRNLEHSIITSSTDARAQPRPTRHCPIKGGYCCQVMDGNGESVIALQHPFYGQEMDNDNEHLYFASVTRHAVDHIQGVTSQMTPNFFDILLKNDCLPTQKQCHKCLKKMGSCQDCLNECPCYCHALCHIHPPPKEIVEEWRVTLPKYKKDPSRLVPRIIHQTWYETVNKEKYPNMSRLIESFKQTGWDYQFYNDESAAQFLQTNFPPQVLDAYNSILPGAFKADLFRYCVLLIQGGVYADMDVLLESDLDELLQHDIGFMVPIDEPGSKVGHRSCLWNGLLAVAPGHPFLAKTIEMVVNNIRNRFTSVDIDDMLCPNPQLSVSHSVDTLFICGPCILGAGMNTVLGRHMQTEWEIGDVAIWGHDKTLIPSPSDTRFQIPGRTVILNQNKEDMGAHRFTWLERNLMVAATDMPDYDDRPADKEHYSKTHEKVGVFGLKKLYKDSVKANEEIRIVVVNS